MPRLTNDQFCRAHQQLRRLWLNQYGLFAELSAAEQWQLHDYFKPSHELTMTKLLLHRAEITVRRPQLPHQAGKACAKLLRSAAAWSTELVTTSHRTPRSGGRGVQYIRVRSVVRPEINTDALARAIIEMAKADLAARLAAKNQDAENEAGE